MFLNQTLHILYQLWCFREGVKDCEIIYFPFGIVISIQKHLKNVKKFSVWFINMRFFFIWNMHTEVCLGNAFKFGVFFLIWHFFLLKPSDFHKTENTVHIYQRVSYMDFNVSLDGSFKMILYLKNIASWVLKTLMPVADNLITVIYSAQSLLMSIMR